MLNKLYDRKHNCSDFQEGTKVSVCLVFFNYSLLKTFYSADLVFGRKTQLFRDARTFLAAVSILVWVSVVITILLRIGARYLVYRKAASYEEVITEKAVAKAQR
jgi:hypothetical protein